MYVTYYYYDAADRITIEGCVCRTPPPPPTGEVISVYRARAPWKETRDGKREPPRVLFRTFFSFCSRHMCALVYHVLVFLLREIRYAQYNLLLLVHTRWQRSAAVVFVDFTSVSTTAIMCTFHNKIVRPVSDVLRRDQ